MQAVTLIQNFMSDKIFNSPSLIFLKLLLVVKIVQEIWLEIKETIYTLGFVLN